MRFLSPYSPPFQSSPEEIDMGESPHHSVSGRSSPWVVVHESLSAWSSPHSISPHLLRDTSPFLGYAISPHQLSASEERTDPDRASPGRNFPQAEQQGLQPFHGFPSGPESHFKPESFRSHAADPSLHSSGVEYSNGMNWRSSMAQSQGFASTQRHLSTPVLGSSQQFPILASMHSSPNPSFPCRYSPWAAVVRANYNQGRAEPTTVKPEQVMEEEIIEEPETPSESRFPEDLSEAEDITDPVVETAVDDESNEQDLSNNSTPSEETKDAIERSKEPSNPGLRCLVCHREFTRRHNLLTHLETHNPNRRLHKCQHCDLSFTRAKDRDRHILTIHDRSDRYKCRCGRGFPRKDSLARHKLTGCDAASRTPLPMRLLKPKSPSPKPTRKQQTRRTADKSDGKKKSQRRKYSDPPPPTHAPIKQEPGPPSQTTSALAHLRYNDHSWAAVDSRIRSTYPVASHGPTPMYRGFHNSRATVLQTRIKQEDSDSSGEYESDHDNRRGAPNGQRNDQGSESSWNYTKCHF